MTIKPEDTVNTLRKAFRLMANGAADLCYFYKDTDDTKFNAFKDLYTHFTQSLTALLQDQTQIKEIIEKTLEFVEDNSRMDLVEETLSQSAEEAKEFVNKAIDFISSEESKEKPPKIPRGYISRKDKFITQLKSIENYNELTESVDVYSIFTSICGLYEPHLTNPSISNQANQDASTNFIAAFNLKHQLTPIKTIQETLNPKPEINSDCDSSDEEYIQPMRESSSTSSSSSSDSDDDFQSFQPRPPSLNQQNYIKNPPSFNENHQAFPSINPIPTNGTVSRAEYNELKQQVAKLEAENRRINEAFEEIREENKGFCKIISLLVNDGSKEEIQRILEDLYQAASDDDDGYVMN